MIVLMDEEPYFNELTRHGLVMSTVFDQETGIRGWKYNDISVTPPGPCAVENAKNKYCRLAMNIFLRKIGAARRNQISVTSSDSAASAVFVAKEKQ